MKENPKMEIYQLKRQLKKSQKMVEILQKADCTATSATREKLASAVPLAESYGTHAVCDALLLSRATFYNHIFRNKNENAWFLLRDDELKGKVATVFYDSECRFAQTSNRRIPDRLQEPPINTGPGAPFDFRWGSEP